MKKFLKSFKKFNWQGLVAAVIACAVVIGLAAGIAFLVKNDTKKISPGEFSLGSLDENGKFVKSEQALVTKDTFECIGLRIEQDFDSNATYDVYYYDYDERFIEAKMGLTGVYDEDYPLAKLARVVIHPEIPEDVLLDDFKVRFWEVRGIAKELTITVDKNQEYKYDTANLYVEANAVVDSSFTYGEDGKTVTIVECDGEKVTEPIPVTYKNYDVYIRLTEEFDDYTAAIVLTEDNQLVYKADKNMDDLAAGEWVKLEVNLKNLSDGYTLMAKMPASAECYIFGYDK